MKRWLIGLILLLCACSPEAANPAYDAAVRFANAAGQGDDATASALLSEELQSYVSANCPDGSVSACIDGYTPEAWGELISAVFRRAAPDGAAWDVNLIATYEFEEGFSGVCIYLRIEQNEANQWRVTRWAGWVHCGEASSRDMADNPAAPNHAP